MIFGKQNRIFLYAQIKSGHYSLFQTEAFVCFRIKPKKICCEETGFLTLLASKGSRKKVFFYSGPATKKGDKGRATKEI